MSRLIKEKNLKSLSIYQQSLYQHPKLKKLFLELTDQCNLNCLHCGSRCTSFKDTFLSYEIIETVLKKVADRYDKSRIMICLTGGEPLLHPDIFKIIKLSRNLGFSVGITSNGTLLSNDTAIKLKKAGLNTISISIDGLYDIHDNFRNSIGCFNKVIEGCKNLKSVNIEPEALTVVHRNNIKTLEEMYTFLKNIGFYSWRFANIEPIGRAKLNEELLLDGKELKYLFDFIKSKRFDNKNHMNINFSCSHYLGLDYENMVRDFYYQCDAGIQVASIMANGDIGACLDIERKDYLIQGNVYKDDFIDIWENEFKIFRKDKSLDSPICYKCKERVYCKGDSTHTWDFDIKEPRYCVYKMMEEYNNG